ncbi:MAG: sugar ABC transporter permease [Clostridium sp.]
MKNKRTITLFLLPTIIVFSLFMFYPIIKTIYLSFFDWNMISPNMEFVGLENYTEILASSEFWQSALNTVLYIALLLVMNFAIPYGVAYVLAHQVKKFKGFYRSALFMPSIISTVVGSLIFLWLFNPVSGPIAEILGNFGVESPSWLKTDGLVIVILTLVIVWKSFGYNLIILLSGILDVPTDIIEAAKLENLSNTQIFFRIVLPMTSSTALFVLTTTIVFGLQYVFVPINVLTQGGPDGASTNLVYSIYQYGFNFFQTGKASALAVITSVIFFVLMAIKFKVLEKGVYYEN